MSTEENVGAIHYPNRYEEPGAREFVPPNRKLYRTYAGSIIDAFVPNVEVEPIFTLSDKTWGRREPVDFVKGHQLSAEIKMVMEYWSLEKLQGRVVICPVGHRDYELLHLLIELAYEIEGAVGEVKQKAAEVQSLLKGLFVR